MKTKDINQLQEKKEVAMVLTTEDLFNHLEDYELVEIRSPDDFLRGEIAGTHLEEDGTRILEFHWLAEKDSFGFWRNRHPEYPIERRNLKISDIGQGRITITIRRVILHITFFPPSGSSFDPTRIVGLEPRVLERWKNRRSKTHSSKR